MLPLDLIFLTVVLALATWRLLAVMWRPRLRVAAVGVGVLLAAAQWALYGFTWQSVVAYVLLALSALPPLPTGNAARWIGRVALLVIAVGSAGVWILPAVPTLPAPDGRYAVGTTIHRWTDASRDEPRTADTSDRRSVIAQVWYPATPREATDARERLPYIDGTHNLPRTVSGLPGFFMRRYNQIDTHAEASAAQAPSETPWPVVIFSPGYGAPRAVYTGLATRLASRGFVVYVLDHPYESGVTQLPDGRVVGTVENFTPGQRDRTQYMAEQQRVRTADIRFVIDTIGVARVAVIGHSFGGAVSAMVMSEDARVVAAANIDGTPYGDLPDRQLTRPFLLLQSDLEESPHGELFHNGNGKLLANMTAPGYRYEIKNANHFSFTDSFFFLARPGRWLLARLMGGERGPAATQQATADIVAAFLSGPLTGVQVDVAGAAARYPGVLGGPVR